MRILSLHIVAQVSSLTMAICMTPFAGMVRAEELSEQRYKKLLSELRPSESELWRTIPWKIGLLDGQRAAAESEKPIFIWAMDGHPLGCT